MSNKEKLKAVSALLLIVANDQTNPEGSAHCEDVQSALLGVRHLVKELESEVCAA